MLLLQLKIYQEVIEDVILGVRECFLEDGVDEQVLQELKQTWEAKLLASKAVESQKPENGNVSKFIRCIDFLLHAHILKLVQYFLTVNLLFLSPLSLL